MTLQSQFNNKLLLLISNAERTQQAYLKTLELIKSFFISESIDSELNRFFALKKNELNEFYIKFQKLVKQIEVIEKHKDIIISTENRNEKALKILDQYADSNSELFSEIQAIFIYLENKLKERR